MAIANLKPAELVTQYEHYEKMLAHLQEQDAIAIDTESNSLFAYQEQVCLIQLSSRERDFLLDPFAFHELDGLGELFANPHIEKLFHAGDYDIACLKRDFGFEFRHVFDTMIAASALGEKNLGLGTLLEKYFGIELAKKFQRANWGERPLKTEMLAYAQADSHFLIKLRDYLVPQLRKASWLELVQEDSNAMAKLTPPMKPHVEDFWRIKGLRELDNEAISLLAALNHTREILAEKNNRPPFKIFGDSVLIKIAEAAPKNTKELLALSALSSKQFNRFGGEVLRAINQWKQNPIRINKPFFCRPSDAELMKRERLMDWRKQVALREKVASNLILPRDLVDKLSKAEICEKEGLKALMADYPLRYERFGERISEILQRSMA